VVIETVGVGQSETAVSDMVDCFVLLAAPGGGDELQGLKRGIIELADVVVVNKADGDLAPAAGRAVADYRSAVGLLRPKHPGWEVPVLPASALEGTGIDEAWAAVEALVTQLAGTGQLDALRSAQAVSWMWEEIRETLVESFRRDPRVGARYDDVVAAVRTGELSPASAARTLLARRQSGLPRQPDDHARIRRRGRGGDRLDAGGAQAPPGAEHRTKEDGR
jgi:LAO/AO transport system kinase